MQKQEIKWLKSAMKHVPNNGVVVEIGSWTGGSSEALASGIKKWCPTAYLICVDPFDMEYIMNTKGLRKKMKKYEDKPFDVFTKRMAHYEHVLMKMTSEVAVSNFKESSIDFVFIDGNHDYEYVKKDIQLWWPKLKAGSVMCGHDYNKHGVKKAVQECCKNHTVATGTIWKTKK